MNTKLTWGLAWAGLALVVAVPSLDFFTGKGATQPAILTTDTAPVKVASTTPAALPTPTAVKPGTVSINPDGTISKPATASTAITSVSQTTPAPAAPTQVASLEVTPAPKIAPIPAPLSERPRPTAIPAPVVSTAPVITSPVVTAPAAEAPLVIDETTTASIDSGPVPPADIVPDPSWNAAQLREYLDTHGMLTPYDPNADESDASVIDVPPPTDSDYDPDGFFLGDGPNTSTTTTRSARSRWWTDDAEEQGFTLF